MTTETTRLPTERATVMPSVTPSEVGGWDPTQPPVPAALMVAAFPLPDPAVVAAYADLALAADSDEEQLEELGDLRTLPRPWDPASCTAPELRWQLWQWLDTVVIWLNREYVWDQGDLILPCWPQHPHLVHEVAVLADQRYRCGQALTSDSLEEWHRYTLPEFTKRWKARTHGHCESKHGPWPARSGQTRHLADEARLARNDTYDNDVAAAAGS